MVRANHHRLVVSSLVLTFLVFLALAQVSFQPTERFDRPKTELGRATSLTFGIPAVVAASWISADGGFVLLREVSSKMLMNRLSGVAASFELDSSVLLEKWEYLVGSEIKASAFLIFGGRKLELSVETPPSKLDAGIYLFKFLSQSPLAMDLWLGQTADLRIALALDGCVVGESRIRCPFVDFSGNDLTNGDWREADLRLAQFDQAKLDGANFDQADLSGAIFLGTSTEGTHFEQTKLFAAIFE